MKVQNILKIASFLLFSGAALTAAVYAKDLNGTNQSPQPFKSRISSVVTEREVIDGKERQSKYMVAILSSDNGSMMSKILPIQPNKPGDPTFIPFSTTVYFDNDGCSYGSIDIGFVDSVSKGMSQKEKELLRYIYEKKDRLNWDMQGCIISKLDKNTRERGGNSVITITTPDETNILLQNKVTVSGNTLTIETQYEYDITSEQLRKTFLSEVKSFSTENWDKKMKNFLAKVSVESILKFDTTIKKPLYFKQTSKIISAQPKILSDAPIPSQVKEITYGEWKESFF